MHIDHCLEKRLVRSAHIDYDKYDEDLAVDVTFVYFHASISILGFVALVYWIITTSGLSIDYHKEKR